MKETLLKILVHRDLVRKNMHKFISKFQERAIMHDISKLYADEFDGFVEADNNKTWAKYGTLEYLKQIKKNKGIQLHLERNTHHPEYWQKEPTTGCYLPDGHKEMPFLDILEMVIDWKSAAETYGTDFQESIEYSIDRFKFDEKQAWLIRMIAKDL